MFDYHESDPALMLFAAACERFGLELPAEDAAVLELGCAESDWQERMRAQFPYLRLTGVDVHPGRPAMGWTFVQGSAINPKLFASEQFDIVVMLGALEHFGMGYYGDPVDDDGDTKAMQNVARWLKPHGWVYFDVPCQPTYGVRPNRHFRDYAPASVDERLIVKGLRERCRGYSKPEPDAGTWVDEPTVPREPYWFVAVVADRES